MPSRILLIEDDPASLDLMTYLLQAFGHTVLRTIDGEEGLEAARRHMPDLILCDLRLPGMDGFEVARWLKTNPALSKIPLIAITAYTMVGDREKVLSSGFDGYIAKPIVPETFVALIDSYLPLLLRSTSTVHVLSEAEEDLAGRRMPQKGARILVIDDSPENRDLLRSILEPRGFEVSTAATIQQALSVITDRVPDAIVSDFHVGKERGNDFLVRIRAIPELRRVPFIFISNSDWSEAERKRAVACGADKFLLRPFDPQQLLAEIEATLKERKTLE